MKAATWGQTLLNSTYKGHLEQSNVQKQKVEYQLPGAGGRENAVFLFTGCKVPGLQGERSSGDWVHNKVNELNATEKRLRW